MRDLPPDEILNSLLSDWHKWQLQTPVNGTDRLADPTFRDVRPGRYWESQDDIVEKQSHTDKMKAIEFAVAGDSKGQGGMPDLMRYVIQEQARNLHTGVAVWRNPRLPVDPMERAVLLQEARNALMKRLLAAGVM